MVEVKEKASFDPVDDSREFLEMEVNYVMDEFDIVRAGVDVISDQIWYGYGVSYMGWNNMRMDKQWKTGKPEFRYLDCRSYWVDESSNERGWTNRRWEFAKFQIDVEDAREMFPEYDKKISEIMSDPGMGDAPDRKECFDLFLCQYRDRKSVV